MNAKQWYQRRFSRKIPLSMKILATTPPLHMQSPSLSLKTHFPLHRRNYHHPPHACSLASPIFSQSKQQQQQLPDSMATCVDTSLTDAAGQANRLSRNPTRPQNDDLQYSYVKFYRPDSFDYVWRPVVDDYKEIDDLWVKMKEEAQSDVKQEPILSSYYHGSILSHSSLESALANHLSIKLSNSTLPRSTLLDLFRGELEKDLEIMRAVRDDLRAVKQRDPACVSYVHCLLNFKGFLACQAHRIAHRLWLQGRKVLALLIQNRVSEVFAVDIHPGARIGRGILLDHATGFVVGETAVIGNNVSILHNVTLGGTGKASGDRHPKIGDGVLIGAGTCILGNIRVGDGAKIGAGSVVLKEVPPRTTAVGNPARLVGGKENPIKLDKIPSFTMDHTSHISDWSDYVI